MEDQLKFKFQNIFKPKLLKLLNNKKYKYQKKLKNNIKLSNLNS